MSVSVDGEFGAGLCTKTMVIAYGIAARVHGDGDMTGHNFKRSPRLRAATPMLARALGSKGYGTRVWSGKGANAAVRVFPLATARLAEKLVRAKVPVNQLADSVALLERVQIILRLHPDCEGDELVSLLGIEQE